MTIREAAVYWLVFAMALAWLWPAINAVSDSEAMDYFISGLMFTLSVGRTERLTTEAHSPQAAHDLEFVTGLGFLTGGLILGVLMIVITAGLTHITRERQQDET